MKEAANTQQIEVRRTQMRSSTRRDCYKSRTPPMPTHSSEGNGQGKVPNGELRSGWVANVH